MQLFKSIIKSICDFLAGRWYILYVSGHGSGFRREGGLMTKRMALYEADHWEGDACTIGGKALIKNVFTGKVIDFTGRNIDPRYLSPQRNF